MSVTDTSRPLINKIQAMASAVMGFGVLAIGAGFWVEPESIYQSYLIGWLFWNGVAVAFLGLLMLHHIVGGDWGFVNRRFLEAGAMTTAVTALMSIPILAGMGHLYMWANPASVPAELEHVFHEKAPYLNLGFFYARAFAISVQDRVIRLEMRLRLTALAPELMARFDEFTVRQLVALRFAGDRELRALAQQTLEGKFASGKAIKQQIQDWKADYWRA